METSPSKRRRQALAQLDHAWANRHSFDHLDTRRARCRGLGALMYDREVHAALKLCSICAIRTPCLVDALRTDLIEPTFGVRGGTTAQDRRVWLRQHRREQ